jgi:hypothetical protein
VPVVGYGISVRGIPYWSLPGPTEQRHVVDCTLVDHLDPFDPGGGREGEGWRVDHDDDQLRVDIEGGSTVHLRVDGQVGSAALRPGRWDAEKTAMFFLMGVLPLGLPRFGLAPLHASAFSFDGRHSLIVMGDSGAGKSTMLSIALDQGATFIGDDTCAITSDGVVWPGPGLVATRGAKATALPTYNDKPVRLVETLPRTPLVIGASVILQPEAGCTTAMEELSGAEALLALLTQSRSPWLSTGPRYHELRLRATEAVANRPVAIARYDQGVVSKEELFDLLLGWFSKAAGSAARSPSEVKV